MSSDVAAPGAVETPWRRLDRRMLVVGPLGSLGRLVPIVALLLVTGQGDIVRVWVAVAAGALVVGAGVLRWRTTRYRITHERVELHSGWLRRQRRSVPRDRIRTVDLTARLLHRVFGLAVVQVGAASGAQQESAGLSLDAVSKAEADRLRRELLDRSPGTHSTGTHSAGGAPGEGAHSDTVRSAGRAPETATTGSAPEWPAPGQELARLSWSWLRFAPLTFSSLAGIGAIGAAAFNLLDDLGLDPREIGAVDVVADRLASAPIWLGVAVVGTGLLTTAVVGAVALFAERWFDYRLTREPDGTLRVKRGLLTRRSLSVSEQRLRGAEIREPLLLRAGRGAQCRALSTGLSRDVQGGALQPPVPRGEAHRVASAVLREHPLDVTEAPLRRHPPAARVRRINRAVVPAAVLVAAAFAVGATVPALDWSGPASLVLLPLAVLLGLDRHRNLGHELTARYLVARQGALQRRTVALHRAGVIGWTFRQSIFQRRAGLATVEAVTAAGEGGYRVLDVTATDGVALADATVPRLLTPFLARPAGP